LSFVEAQPSEFVLSAIKQSEDTHGLIVRGCNVSDRAIEVTLKLGDAWRRAMRVSLNEEHQGGLISEDNVACFLANPKQVVTLRFEVHR